MVFDRTMMNNRRSSNKNVAAVPPTIASKQTLLIPKTVDTSKVDKRFIVFLVYVLTPHLL
ncbi:hypothetical protein Hanom_Chr13g01188131 [Helianthus anomalus]